MKKADRLVVIALVTEVTVTVTGSQIAYLLEQAQVPRQWDPIYGCWTTSRRAVGDLEAWCATHHRPVQLEQVLL